MSNDHDMVGTAGAVGRRLPRRGDPCPCSQPPQGKVVGVSGLTAHDSPAGALGRPNQLAPLTDLRGTGGPARAGLLQEESVGPLQAGAVDIRKATRSDTYVDTEPTQDLSRLDSCLHEQVTVARPDNEHVKSPFRTARGPAWYRRGRRHQAVTVPDSAASYRYRLWWLCRRCRAHPRVLSQSSWLSSQPAAAGCNPATASTHLPIVQSFLRTRHKRCGQDLWPNREDAIAPTPLRPPQHERRHLIEISTVRQRRHRPAPALRRPRQPAASVLGRPERGHPRGSSQHPTQTKE